MPHTAHIQVALTGLSGLLKTKSILSADGRDCRKGTGSAYDQDTLYEYVKISENKCSRDLLVLPITKKFSGLVTEA